MILDFVKGLYLTYIWPFCSHSVAVTASTALLAGDTLLYTTFCVLFWIFLADDSFIFSYLTCKAIGIASASVKKASNTNTLLKLDVFLKNCIFYSILIIKGVRLESTDS